MVEAMRRRLWVIEAQGYMRGPDEIVWDQEDAEERITRAKSLGYKVHGPYVPEGPGYTAPEFA